MNNNIKTAHIRVGDVSVIRGESSYKRLSDYVKELFGLWSPSFNFEARKRLWLGKAMEDVVIEMLCRFYGFHFDATYSYREEEVLYLFESAKKNAYEISGRIDAVIFDTKTREEFILEIKTTTDNQVAVPYAEHYTQLQMYLYLWKLIYGEELKGVLAYFTSRFDLDIFTIELDDNFIKDTLTKIGFFVDFYYYGRKIPKEEEREIIKFNKKEEMKALKEMYNLYRKQKELNKDLSKRLNALKTHFKDNYEGIISGDGFQVEIKENKREYVDIKKVKERGLDDLIKTTSYKRLIIKDK